MLVAGSRVVTPDRVLDPGWVELDGRRVAAVGDGAPPRGPDVELAGGWLVPGFVDLHSHGGGGASVIGADAESVARVVATHLQHGTTTIVASLVSALPEPLAADVSALADLADDGVVAGIHLEGPWIAPQFRGAHDAAALRDPDPEEVERLLALGRGHVAMVTLAPEWEHGLDAVRRVTGAGAIAAVGHTAADYARTVAAIEAGASVATHLFNAMRPIHHREPGPIPALLADERVTVELIADGTHVHPAVLDLVRRATPRVALVTDAMSAAGGPDGEYRLGDLVVRVAGGVARLAEGGALAGSTLTMDAAVRRAVHEAGMSVAQAAAAAATTPARLLGLTDRGAIAAGARADLCHLDDDLILRRVWRAGTELQ